jgi:hypothetical protein
MCGFCNSHATKFRSAVVFLVVLGAFEVLNGLFDARRGSSCG